MRWVVFARASGDGQGVPEDLPEPFHFSEARTYGLTKHQLVGRKWIRLGGGFYASTDTPLIRLTAASRRLPRSAVFSGCTAAFLHGLDPKPPVAVEATLPPPTKTAHLAGITIRRSRLALVLLAAAVAFNGLSGKPVAAAEIRSAAT